MEKSVNLINKSTKLKLRDLLKMFTQISYLSNALYNEYIKDVKKLNVHTKEENEKFTSLDFSIQIIVEDHLNKFYKNLNFIGEEDTSKDVLNKEEKELIEKFIKTEKIIIDPLTKLTSLQNYNEFTLSLDKEYEIEDLTLFCDPIDGTSNLIKGKYEIVSFLIGLTYKGQALIGYTHFFNYENSGNNLGFFNIPGFGIYELSFKTNGLLDNYTEVEFSVDKTKIEESKELKFIITSSRESPVMTKGKCLKYFSIRTLS